MSRFIFVIAIIPVFMLFGCNKRDNESSYNDNNHLHGVDGMNINGGIGGQGGSSGNGSNGGPGGNGIDGGNGGKGGAGG